MGGQCGESTLPKKYESYAEKFDSDLKEGTCASQGYTVPEGSKDITVPFIGTIHTAQFEKPAVAADEQVTLYELAKGLSDKPLSPRNTRFMPKSSLASKKEIVPLKDTLLMMEPKTLRFHSSEILKLLFTPRLLPKEVLTILLIFGKLKDTNVDKLLLPRNTNNTLRNSIKTSLKELVPLKDTLSKKEPKK